MNKELITNFYFMLVEGIQNSLIRKAKQFRFRSRLSKIALVAAQLATAIVASVIFNWLHVPLAWLLAPMLVGIIYVIAQEDPQPFPTTFSIVGQAIIALETSIRFSPNTLTTAATYAIPLLICIFITGSMSLLNGYLLWRWAGIDRMTGFLGSIPGASPSIVAMSEEMGADAIAVAILQYLRLLLVALTIPAIISIFFPVAPTIETVAILPVKTHPSLPALLNLGVLAGCGSLGIWIGRKLRLPASLFLGPFLVGLVAFLLLPYQIQIPRSVFMGGLLLLGLSIGLKFNFHAVRTLAKAVLLELVLVLLLILICLGTGYGFHLVTGVNPISAILGSTPGGITPIMAMTLQMGGDSGLVLAMQMTRMLLILLFCPWFVTFFRENVTKSAEEAIEE
ncbi:MAG: AbrB family transcriptional regulator [Hydrococcus sp. Prado102]|nr:AbrB family transcriptional regulator [Hydrococcus sp. Prado102]